MAKNELKPQVPGDVATQPEADIPDDGGDILDPANFDAAATAGTGPADVEIEADEKDTLITELYAEIAYLKNLLANANIDVKTMAQVGEESLLDMADVDPLKIKKATLTKGGWVLPA